MLRATCTRARPLPFVVFVVLTHAIPRPRPRQTRPARRPARSHRRRVARPGLDRRRRVPAQHARRPSVRRRHDALGRSLLLPDAACRKSGRIGSNSSRSKRCKTPTPAATAATKTARSPGPAATATARPGSKPACRPGASRSCRRSTSRGPSRTPSAVDVRPDRRLRDCAVHPSPGMALPQRSTRIRATVAHCASSQSLLFAH